MKSTEEHLNDYFDKYNELSRKGELWRLRFTPENFIKEVERIRMYEIEARQSGSFTEDLIQHNVERMLSILLMDKSSLEEVKEHYNRRRKALEQKYIQEAPQVQEYVKHIQVPLEFDDVRIIFNALRRNQITLEMLPKNVLEEFKQTRQFKIIDRANRKK